MEDVVEEEASTHVEDVVVVADADDTTFDEVVGGLVDLVAEAEQHADEVIADQSFANSDEEEAAHEEAKNEFIDEGIKDVIADASVSDVVEIEQALQTAETLVDEAIENDVTDVDEILSFADDHLEDAVEEVVTQIEEAAEEVSEDESVAGFLQGGRSIEDGFTKVVATIDGEQVINEEFVSSGDGLEQKTLKLVIPSCTPDGQDVEVDIDLFENHADGASLRENTCHDGENFITRD